MLEVKEAKKTLSQKIEELVHEVSPEFWVPAVGNDQLGKLFDLLVKKNLLPEIEKLVSKENKL